jgi:hypothetical protein
MELSAPLESPGPLGQPGSPELAQPGKQELPARMESLGETESSDTDHRNSKSPQAGRNSKPLALGHTWLTAHRTAASAIAEGGLASFSFLSKKNSQILQNQYRPKNKNA